MKHCSLGAKTLKRSMIGPWPIQVLTSPYLWPNRRPHGGCNNVPLRRNSGPCVPRMHIPRPQCIPCVSGSNAFCQNSLSSWPSQAFLPTIIWLNAACAPSSLHAKSAAGLAVHRALRLAWLFSVSSVLGSPKDSIPSLGTVSISKGNEKEEERRSGGV